MRFAAVVFLVLLLLPAVGVAGPLEDGEKASSHADYQTALQLWRPLADHGNAEAQILIGDMYKYGRGAKHDDLEAMKWFQKAINTLQPLADRGNPTAQYQIGNMHFSGQGFTQGTAEPVEQWQQQMNGCREAFGWYKKSADQGYAPAQVKVGQMYRVFTGDVIPMESFALSKHDDAEAMKWFLKAAEQGNVDAEFYIGLLYDFGNPGVNKDPVQSYRWYSLAEAAGDTRAGYDKNQIALKLTPEQIAEGKRLAAEWMAAHPQPPAPAEAKTK